MCLNTGTTEEQKGVLEVYLERGDECNPKNVRQETPLHITIHENIVAMAKILIRNSAYLETQGVFWQITARSSEGL